MATTNSKVLGILRPVGGGDPIPLAKPEMVVGRRPTSDIRLDFDNVSGKHCVLRLIKGVWHVRDLKSTNGTTVNGQLIAHEHGILPDDELGIASHFFNIDYDPVAPTAIIDANIVLEEEIAEQPRKRHSLMELAGLEGDAEGRGRRGRPEVPPERIERESADEADFDDAMPRQFDAPKKAETSDDDFFKMIQDDVDDRPRRGG